MDLLAYLLSLGGMVLTAGAVFNLVLHRKGHPTAIWRARRMIVAGIACLIVVALLPVERQHPTGPQVPSQKSATQAIPPAMRESVATAIAQLAHVQKVEWEEPENAPVELVVHGDIPLGDHEETLGRICREVSAQGLRNVNVRLVEAAGPPLRKVCR